MSLPLLLAICPASSKARGLLFFAVLLFFVYGSVFAEDVGTCGYTVSNKSLMDICRDQKLASSECMTYGCTISYTYPGDPYLPHETYYYSTSGCPDGTVKDGGLCKPELPDCNVGSITGGNYWDVSTSSCQPDPDASLCIEVTGTNSESVAIAAAVAAKNGSSGSFFCGPMGDCIPVGSKCTNDPNALADAAAKKQAAFEQAQWNAQNSANRADASKSSAAASASQAAANRDAAFQTRNDARSNYESVRDNPSASQAQKDAAFKQYSDAEAAYGHYSKNADDASSSAASSASSAAASQGHADSVPSAPHSNGAFQRWSDAAGAADSAGNGAASASGSMSAGGTGTGTGSGSGQSIDVSALAKEATLAGIANTLKGTGTLGGFTVADAGTTVGSFDQNLADANAALDASKINLRSKIDEVRASASSYFQPVTVSGGALPVYSFGNYKGVSLKIDLNDYASSFSVLAGVIMALAWLAAASIVLTK